MTKSGASGTKNIKKKLKNQPKKNTTKGKLS